LLSAFLLSVSQIIFAQDLNLFNPSDNNGIEYRFSGFSGSSHYLTPLQIDLVNNSSESKTIKIPAGQLIHPQESQYQSFVITNDELIVLEPGESKNFRLSAMCIERYDKAPSKNIEYMPGNMADSNLMLMVNYIKKHQCYNYEAQTAVWAMVGDYQLGDIVGFDTTLTRNLVELVALAKGLEVPEMPAPDDYARNYYAPESVYKATMKGRFEFDLYDEKEIIIAMCDKDNIVVRELYKNLQCKPGKHKQEYKFDATQYRDEFYFIRLIEEGEVVLELKVKTLNRTRRG